ncbi:[protein-PII] uridylyltransferase [Microlunatus ginsengisoli]|uniref:Bifunctional uridylyltransferase/uridylyl-removing enzyme n=1 Tax=Microlunatus ginsengisoli TaxID=363863 RepID=A0ABP6ZPD5_9ACTN
MLVHAGGQQAAVNGLAEKLWYPLWDAGVKLDHSVRTPAECAEVAGRELSAGVGLLDLRVIAGDAELVAGARSALLGSWRNNARKRLPELLSSLDERLALAGDAAYLLEPDLKEARGGFRDMTMLRALAATWLTDRPHSGVEEPYDRLLDVRDALHVTSGRALDRLLAGEVADVADLLGFADTDALRREVSMAARRIGQAVYLTSRAARQVLPQRRVLSFVRRERRPEFSRADHGLIVHAGEVGLDKDTDPRGPYVGLQAGALAAERGLLLSPVTVANLTTHAPAIPAPWPDEAREALLRMLAAGENVLPVWEDLDLSGIVARWLPAWELISARPQHNPVHIYTVDRHSIQTVVEAHRGLTQVERPDLLLLACLFHDIGKGANGGVAHAAVGAPIARDLVEQLGLGADDADVVERLVREHLTLVELATRRDHTDPATHEALVKAVDGRTEILNLLRRLTEADARAAGPAAWTPWRAQLINDLANQVEGLLVGEPLDPHGTEFVDLGLARSVGLDGVPRIRLETKPGGSQLLCAATDRLGLFSDTAGLLVAHGISVRSAVLHTVEGVSVNTWRTDKVSAKELPDLAFLVKELQRLEAGDRSMLAGVQRREARAQNAVASEPHVAVVPDASGTAAVIEVRTADRAGLLYALGQAVTAEQLSIRSAHVATLAGQAIDTFYLTEPDGSLPSTDRTAAAVRSLTAAAAARRAPTPTP